MKMTLLCAALLVCAGAVAQARCGCNANQPKPAAKPAAAPVAKASAKPAPQTPSRRA